jgi:hypothetical protein
VPLEPPMNPGTGIKFPDPLILVNKKYRDQMHEFAKALLDEAKSGSLDKLGQEAAAGLVKLLVVGAEPEEQDALISRMTRPAAIGLACLALEDAWGWRRQGVTDRRVQFFLDTVITHVEVPKGLGELAAYIAQTVYFQSRLHPEGGMVPVPSATFYFDYKAWRESYAVE